MSYEIGDKVITVEDCPFGLFEKGLISEVVHAHKDIHGVVFGLKIKDKKGESVFAELGEIKHYEEETQ